MSATAVRLYRRVLRLHRQKLPAVQRAMGDEYVKKEFRAHQMLEPDSEFHAPFQSAWEDYCAKLDAFKPLEGSRGWSKDGIREEMRLGRNMSQEEIASLSEEQRDQLSKLKLEARNATDKLYNES